MQNSQICVSFICWLWWRNENREWNKVDNVIQIFQWRKKKMRKHLLSDSVVVDDAWYKQSWVSTNIVVSSQIQRKRFISFKSEYFWAVTTTTVTKENILTFWKIISMKYYILGVGCILFVSSSTTSNRLHRFANGM